MARNLEPLHLTKGQAMKPEQLKIAKLDGKEIAYYSETLFLIQVGKGKGPYRTKQSFKGNLGQALMHYNGLNVHSGYKKRLLMNDKVLARELT